MKFLAIFVIALLAFLSFVATENCDEIACAYNYDPVCAQPKAGGKALTFGNECSVKTQACRESVEYKIISHQECPEQ